RRFQLPKVFALSGGRVIPDKRFDWLIEVFSFLKIPLVIVGSVEEDYKKNLLQISKKLDVDVRFLGFVSSEELVALYNKAEVFCFTSPSEDFGLVPIEAMSCGTPVIAWDDGAGPSETVVHGVNGYLIKPYDRKDFAEKVKKVVEGKFKQKQQKKILDSVKKFREETALKPFHDSIEKTFKNRI
ncbi:glycosyltransferase family 4 protein, partial [Candidatus Woesearchaeota archaeon]|nr:glycosyltransferase family 4 protein [Candidatus Woesearchaeota archaeon]